MILDKGVIAVIALLVFAVYVGNAKANKLVYFNFATANEQGQIDHAMCLSEAESEAQVVATNENTQRTIEWARGITKYVNSGGIGKRALSDGWRHIVPGWGLFASAKTLTNSTSENFDVAEVQEVTVVEQQGFEHISYKKCMNRRGHNIASVK